MLNSGSESELESADVSSSRPSSDCSSESSSGCSSKPSPKFALFSKFSVSESEVSSSCPSISEVSKHASNPASCSPGRRVDCIVNIDQALPQFSIIKPEEAFLAAPLVSSKVVVIGEVASEHPAYQTAVVVRKPYEGGFENLKGKRFCHPGFKHDELVTKYVLGQFESTIINLNTSYCETGDNATIVEKRIRALNDFFGSSCRPGAWTESDELDAELKKKYSNLCDLCGSDGCAINYQVPFNDSLSCLTNRGGDVAITTLNDAKLFFNSTSNAENFQYLCENGTVADFSNPCTWTDQLNRLIITESSSASAVRTFISNQLSAHISSFTPFTTSDIYLASLRKVLDLQTTDKIKLVETVPLTQYVSFRRTIPTVDSSRECGLSVTWCTLNASEQQKCIWLQQASLNAGIQPVINCAQSTDNDTLSCLNDIREGKADIAFTDVNYGYIALKKGLTVVAYTETDTRQLSSILIVVRANESDPPKSLQELKRKRSCFPEYGGKEWLSFIHTLREKKILENSCDYGKIFSDFVDTSCVPSANSNDYEIENADQSKLCAQCIPVVNTLTHAYCNADFGNKYYGSNGALKCLEDVAAEYAVITRNDVTAYDENTSNQFRVLSKNGSLAEYTGFNVDEGAALTVLTAGEVVAKADSLKRDDIVLLLRAIEYEFGQRLDKFFKAFESFNNTRDLLFPDSTPGLTFGGTSIKYVDNFRNMLEFSEKCMADGVPPSSAVYVLSSKVLVFVIALVTVHLYFY